jgi:hypothetical protein
MSKNGRLPNQTCAQSIAIQTPAVQPTLSLCYPDRHRRSDEQIAFSTLRTLGTTLVGVAVAIGIAVYMGVR